MNDSLKPMIDYTSEKDYKSMSSTPWNNSPQSSCSRCTSEFDETPESEEIPLNIDKQLSFIISILKVLGIVKLRGKLGSLIIWITLPLIWVPVVYLSICIMKANHVMASPSGLPTVLLFAGMAGSQLFGVRYSTSHYRDLRANIRLALRRGNLRRDASILLSASVILHGVYLALLLHLYLRQPIPIPWIGIIFVYFLGFGFCSFVCIVMNVLFSTVCTSIRIKIHDFKERLRNWKHGLSEALNEYNEICDFMNRQSEAIKWWILCNLLSFITIWIVDFHLWQILGSAKVHTDVARLVLYNCSCYEGYNGHEDKYIPIKDITGCEILFSFLVFFLFTSPLFWAAMVSVDCNAFKEWVNKMQTHTDDKPLGEFSIKTLDFFINRVQMANYFAFRLFGINITKLVYSVTGLMTTVQVVLSVVANKFLPD